MLTYIEIEKGKDLGDLGHDFMINNIDKMKLVLKEFMDPNNQLNVNDDTYLGWLYQGLEGSQVYQKEVVNKNLQQYYNNLTPLLINIPVNCN